MNDTRKQRIIIYQQFSLRMPAGLRGKAELDLYAINCREHETKYSFYRT